jgi:hypothetical protein
MSQIKFDALFAGYPIGTLGNRQRQEFQLGIQQGIVQINRARELLSTATLENPQPLYDTSGVIHWATLCLVPTMPPAVQVAMNEIRVPFIQATNAYTAAAGQRRGLFKSGPTQQDLDDCKSALDSVMESLLHWYNDVNPDA